MYCANKAGQLSSSGFKCSSFCDIFGFAYTAEYTVFLKGWGKHLIRQAWHFHRISLGYLQLSQLLLAQIT